MLILYFDNSTFGIIMSCAWVGSGRVGSQLLWTRGHLLHNRLAHVQKSCTVRVHCNQL